MTSRQAKPAGQPRLPQLWTAEEDRTLKRMYRAGRSDPEIATRLERSTGSVEGRRRCLGLVKESAGTPSLADLKARAAAPPLAPRPDLFALWDQRNTALRERLRERGELLEQ